MNQSNVSKNIRNQIRETILFLEHKKGVAGGQFFIARKDSLWKNVVVSLFVYVGPAGKCIICNFGRRFVNILSESGWLPSSLSPAHNVGSSPVKLTGNAKFQSLVDITNHQHYNTTMSLHSLSHQPVIQNQISIK